MSVQAYKHPNIEIVALTALHPNPNNARTHNRKSRRAIAASIKRFGFLVPIIADEDGKILAGHGRYYACQEDGITEVPVIRAKFLTKEDARAFALAENRIAELSGWDEGMLATELNALFESGYMIDVTGFTTADLDLSIPEVKTGKPEKVELPNREARAVSRLGDLWRIGPHRIFNGDSRLPASYETLLEGELAAMVFGDAPYGVKIGGNVSGLGAVRHREFEMMSGEQTPAELIAFLRACFRNCVRFSEPASIHYQCMDWRHIREILDAADGVYRGLSDQRGRWGVRLLAAADVPQIESQAPFAVPAVQLLTRGDPAGGANVRPLPAQPQERRGSAVRARHRCLS